MCWRIIKDWVEAQMVILETKMVKIEQVFLPYLYDLESDKTFYEISISKNLIPTAKQLTN